jgi:hypothetical protein
MLLRLFGEKTLEKSSLSEALQKSIRKLCRQIFTTRHSTQIFTIRFIKENYLPPPFNCLKHLGLFFVCPHIGVLATEILLPQQ